MNYKKKNKIKKKPAEQRSNKKTETEIARDHSYWKFVGKLEDLIAEAYN
jgi:hypothetical protein